MIGDRYLAIDYGTKRVGLAITDPLKMIAQPYDKLDNNSQLLNNLEKVIKGNKISRIILGNPIKLDGTESFASEAVRKFSAMLSEKFSDIEIVLQDERMTTAESQKRMIEADLSRKKRKEKIDQTAAALILESYLKKNEI